MFLTDTEREDMFFFILDRFQSESRAYLTAGEISAIFYGNDFEFLADQTQIGNLLAKGVLAGWIDKNEDDQYRITDCGKRKANLLTKDELRKLAELLVVKGWSY